MRSSAGRLGEILIFPVLLILCDVNRVLVNGFAGLADVLEAVLGRVPESQFLAMIAIVALEMPAQVLRWAHQKCKGLTDYLSPYQRERPAPEGAPGSSDTRLASPLFLAIASKASSKQVKRLIDENLECMVTTDERGATPLLYACLVENWDLVQSICNDDDYAHEKRVQWVMAQYRLSEKAPLAKLFKGENALHIAIVQHRIDMVKFLLDFVQTPARQREFLGHEAVGLFFSPGKQEWDVFGKPVQRMAKSTEAVRLYYGGYPLAFAVCTNQIEMVQLLVTAYKADVYAKDRFGNTLLHMCVIHEVPEMFDIVLRLAGGDIVPNKGILWCRDRLAHPVPVRPLWEEKNRVKKKHSPGPCEMWTPSAFPTEASSQNEYDELTPLVFACELGSKVMFTHILRLFRLRQWRYGCFSSYLYSLDELSGRDGAVAVTLRNSHTQLINTPVIRSLLDRQWESGMRDIFFHKLSKAVLVNIMVTITSIVAFIDPDIRSWTPPRSLWGLFVWLMFSLCNVALICLAIDKLTTERRELASKGWEYFHGPFTARFENICSSLFNVLVMCLVTVRHFEALAETYEQLFASLATLLGWTYSLFFLLGVSKETGVFLISLWRMLFEDVAVFTLVFLVFALAFSGSFFHLLPAVNQDKGKTIADFSKHLGHSVGSAFGGYDIEAYEDSWISSALYILYTVLVPVLLINVLTAKMTNTIENIQESSLSLWIIERARIMKSFIDEEEGGFQGLVNEGLVKKFWKEIDVEDLVEKTRDRSASPASDMFVSPRLDRVMKKKQVFEVVEDETVVKEEDEQEQ